MKSTHESLVCHCRVMRTYVTRTKVGVRCRNRTNENQRHNHIFKRRKLQTCLPVYLWRGALRMRQNITTCIHYRLTEFLLDDRHVSLCFCHRPHHCTNTQNHACTRSMTKSRQQARHYQDSHDTTKTVAS